MVSQMGQCSYDLTAFLSTVVTCYFMTSQRLFFWFSSLVALVFALSGCSTSPVVPALPERSGGVVALPISRVSADQAVDVTVYALGLVGVPYRYGGNTPESGFDCSGLIGHVYRSRAGIVPPRTVAQLQGWGAVVPAEQLRSGDLVLFAQKSAPTHAGIYVGQGRFVHAPSSGGEVRLESLSARHWAAQKISFRRP